MAFAPYFGKAALSAAAVLRNFDYDAFRTRLEARSPTVAFDSQAASSLEGRYALELLVNLLARLYPRLSIRVLGLSTAETASLHTALVDAARQINPMVEISSEVERRTGGDATRTVDWTEPTIVVGSTRAPLSAPAYYIGSNDWSVSTSCSGPLGNGESSNPFGAGFAACLGAAAIFRMVFADSLPKHSPADDKAESSTSAGSAATGPVAPLLDPPWSLSLITMSVPKDPPNGQQQSDPTLLDLGEAYLVGIGAIGNAAVWALSRAPRLKGQLHLVDGETVDLSNCQRYTLVTPNSVGLPKVTVGAAEFRGSSITPNVATHSGSADLVVHTHHQTWAEFLTSRADALGDGAYKLERVALALDSARDRIRAQAALPAWIVNSWTQPANVGISRHPTFTDGPCVACLYLPVGGRKSEDVLYAESLGAGPAEFMEIRTRLYDKQPVGPGFIERIAARFRVPYDALASFAARPIHALYTEALCGGIILDLGGALSPSSPVEVPMAFQSALAGILVAAELVIDAGHLRSTPLACRTEFDLLRPLTTHVNVPVAKNPSGNCICQDEVYQSAFRVKYGILERTG